MNAFISKKNISPVFKNILLIIFIFNSTHINAQQSKIDSLKNKISFTKADTLKIFLYEDLGQAYRDEKKMDSSVLSYTKSLEINEKNNYSIQRQCWTIGAIDYILYEMGNYSESLKYASREQVLSEQLNDTLQKAGSNLVFGHDYRELGDYRQSLNHFFKAREILKIYDKHRNPIENAYPVQCIAEVYLKMNKLDSALIFTQLAYKLALARSYYPIMLYSIRILGDIYQAKGDDERALAYYREYVPDYVKYKEQNRDLGFVFSNMAKIFQKKGEMDSLVFYAKKSFSNAQQYSDEQNLFNAATLLSQYYDGRDDHEAFSYLQIASQAKDSMRSSDKIKQAQVLSFNEQVREKEQQEADVKETARNRMIIMIAAILVAIISSLIWYRIRQLRLKYKTILEQKEAEKLKVKYEKQLLELEARALRAQMNPHFIFNCMNSIKALVQQKEEDKAVTYLTTFSKLIRTIFQNSDKREITLFDEIETCKLYTQLESMRFGNKFSYHFNIDETIDLKSMQVPALIIQPFIENAIWHGIMPKEEGGTLSVTILKNDDIISCIIDDDGVGREVSKQNKFKAGPSEHQSKGVHLTQSRLDLDNALNNRNASVEIIDKVSAEGKPAGTKIVLKFVEF